MNNIRKIVVIQRKGKICVILKVKDKYKNIIVIIGINNIQKIKQMINIVDNIIKQ